MTAVNQNVHPHTDRRLTYFLTTLTHSLPLLRRYSMAKKFADLTAQVKTEKRFSRRLDYPAAASTAAARAAPPAPGPPLPHSAAERLSPVVVVAAQRSPQPGSASSSPSSVSRVTVGTPPPQQQQQHMRTQLHVHHEHVVSNKLGQTGLVSPCQIAPSLSRYGHTPHDPFQGFQEAVS